MKSGFVIVAAIAASLALSSGNAQAQNMDDYKSYKEKALSEFKNYKKQVKTEFKAYRDKVNAEFEAFMRRSWERMDSKPPKPQPSPDKDVAPSVVPENEMDMTPENKKITNVVVAPTPKPEPAPAPIAPIEEVKIPQQKWMTVSLYGTSCKVRCDVADKLTLKGLDEDSVADMWQMLGEPKYDNLLADCLGLRKSLDLCDWAYVKLIETVTGKVYGKANNKEAVVFQAYMLTQSGFDVLMARSTDNTRLHMLMASDSDIFKKLYWTVGGKHYYLLDGSGAKSLYIFTESFPETRPMRLLLTGENKFTAKTSSPRTVKSKRYPDMTANVSVNENLLSFYNDYPSSFEKGDKYTKWRAFAMLPLDKVTRDMLYPKLRAYVKGKSENEAVNIILNFVQTAFEYGYDDEIWGGDRPFFAEETIYYPYSDCEDRSILFSRLVRDIVGLDMVLIYYPGHLATAVKFNENVSGDYLVVDGKKYVVCDPTYVNARVGMTMPKMDNSTAIAVKL